MRGLDTVGVPAAVVNRGLPQVGTYITTSGNVSVTSGASNTPGAWTELVAATTVEAQWVVVSVSGTFVSTAAATALFDLAIGAAAAEVAIASSISAGQIGTLANQQGATFVLPLRIPAGSRLSCRLTNAHATPPTANVRAALYRGAGGHTFRSPTHLDVLGANVAASKGVDVTTSATWTEVTAATAEPYQALILTYGGNDASTGSVSYQTVTMGVGASGGEVSIYHASHSVLNTEAYDIVTDLAPVVGHFPVGTRVAVQASAGATEAITTTVIGVPYT